MNRREAREQLFTLLFFETQFVGGEDYDTVYRDELTLRGLEDDAYVRRVFYGIGEHLPELDGMIAKYSSGWKSDRMSRVLRAIMRLAIYEMKYESDIPTKVSLKVRRSSWPKIRYREVSGLCQRNTQLGRERARRKRSIRILCRLHEGERTGRRRSR